MLSLKSGGTSFPTKKKVGVRRVPAFPLDLTLIVPRGWEIGSKQPCLKCQENSATHFVYFWSRKPPSLYISGTSSINYKSKVKAFTSERLPHLLQAVTKISILYNFYHCRVLADRLPAILSGETEIALGTIRVNTEDCWMFYSKT